MADHIMVLNDCSTYTDLDGCMIVAIPDHFTPEDIEELLLNTNARRAATVVTFDER